MGESRWGPSSGDKVGQMTSARAGFEREYEGERQVSDGG